MTNATNALRTAADTVTHTVSDVMDEVKHRVDDVVPRRHARSNVPASGLKVTLLVVVAVIVWKLWSRRSRSTIGESAAPWSTGVTDAEAPAKMKAAKAG
jgi:hypothetical protein